MPRVKTKKKCCKDAPRCKSCPVVLMRLEKDGHAVCCSKAKAKGAEYKVEKSLPKAALKAARRR